MKYLLLLCLFLSEMDHAIYISLSSIKINEQQDWTGRVQVFYDDLEDALQNQDGKRPNLSESKINAHILPIETYLLEHIVLQSKGKLMNYHIGKVYRQNDLVIAEIIGADKWPADEVQISNRILLEIFETQKNIVKIKWPSRERMFYFKKGNTEEMVAE